MAQQGQFQLGIAPGRRPPPPPPPQPLSGVKRNLLVPNADPNKRRRLGEYENDNPEQNKPVMEVEGEFGGRRRRKTRHRKTRRRHGRKTRRSRK